MKIIPFILIFLFIPESLLSQTDSLFSQVNQAQKLRLQNIFSEERDSIFAHFDRSMDELLTSNNICQELPDTSNHYFLVNQLDEINEGQTLVYAFMNNVVIAATDDLTIYSWDGLGGGSYHSYANFLVFTDREGHCIAQQIDTNEDDSDVGYYRIIPIDDYYVALGYGSYGSGKHHFTIKILKQSNGAVLEIDALEIGSNRSQEIDLKYDSETKTFTFNEYLFDDDMGFYSDEYEVMNLTFENGELLKQ